jgi:nicotinate-nucleotide pyrophosphorylase (carboxylating)
MSDGEVVSSGDVVAEVEGNAQAILAAERSALNILAHLSGIATTTREFVEMARQFGIEVYDTRKTRPLLRKVEKYAASVGGAKNHRLALDQAIFVKDNHKLINGGMKGIVEIIENNREKIAGLPLIIEVENVDELELAVKIKPDLILLDNFDFTEIKTAFNKYGDKVEMEVSGGVTPEKIKELSSIGVKRVSSSYFILKAEVRMFKLEVRQVFK